MSWRLLSYDPFTEIATYWQWDELKRENIIKYVARDVQPSLDHAGDLRNDTDRTKQGMKGDNALHYAHITTIVLLQWAREGVDINDVDALFAKVNEREYSRLKTTEAFHC